MRTEITTTNNIPDELRTVAEAKLAANINKSGGSDACWPWTAGTRQFGHGQIQFNGRNWLPHRLAFILENGPISNNLCVLHRCDHPPCCNPRHLFTGTRKDNSEDMVAKGRWTKRFHHRGVTHANAGLTDDQVREIRSLYTTKKWTQTSLAKRFGISQSSVSYIILRRHWAHIQ